MEACRSSGQTVAEWCRENGLCVSTYFSWQRKVFEAVAKKQEACFAQVPVMEEISAQSNVVADVEIGDIRVEIYSGADETTLQALLRAARSC